jgi:putative addiction module component (TIGR02574 family)
MGIVASLERFRMRFSLQELKHASSNLPAEERAELAQFLLNSLEEQDEAGVRVEWLALAEKRMAEVRAGKVVGIPAEEVLPINEERPGLGMREEEWPTAPKGIDTLLERMEQVEPEWLSPEDDATWRAALRTQKESEKTQFLE